MKRPVLQLATAVAAIAVLSIAARTEEHGPKADFGAWVENQLADHSEQLFGFGKPLDESAIGPYTNQDSTKALELARGLQASLVSSAVHNSADQIALWPDNDNPTYLFVCDEDGPNPAVQRVDLSKPANANSTTIVTGLSACDPVRRTPWGSIIVAEEAGATGGFYEILDPLSITTPINVSNRSMGTTSDPRLVKRKAVGSLSFESFAIRPDGTMIFGDELAPSGGAAGGGIYKFVPQVPYFGGGQITMPHLSPFANGTVYGLRVAAAGSSNWGQGAETGKGSWVQVNTGGAGVVDVAGNIILRTAQTLQKFTGYYRPEDMDIDPIAAEDGVFRACWANTGRVSHAGGSLVENGAVRSEVMCLVEEPPSAAVPSPATGTIPVVERFVPGSAERAMYDNLAFQPYTGNLVILEDGPTSIVTANGSQPRGNDLWICLPDGQDADTHTDGCVRFASLKDTSSEPTGFIFLGSGDEAFVSLQHRSVDETNGRGTLLRISGFKIHK